MPVDPSSAAPTEAELAAAMAANPTLRWGAAQAGYVMGVRSFDDMARIGAEYSLAGGVAEQITCPTLVCEAAEDLFFAGQPQQLYDHPHLREDPAAVLLRRRCRRALPHRCAAARLRPHLRLARRCSRRPARLSVVVALEGRGWWPGDWTHEERTTPCHSGRQLEAGQRSRLHIVDIEGTDRVVHESSSAVFEAPNW